jgi:hypothetical protein
MQEAKTPTSSTADAKCALLHEEIAQSARDLSVQCGKPVDRDLAIWLEAEQRLLSVTKPPHGENSGPPRLLECCRQSQALAHRKGQDIGGN